MELTEFDEGPRPADWVGELDKRGIEVVRDVNRDDARAVLRAYGEGGGQRYCKAAAPCGSGLSRPRKSRHTHEQREVTGLLCYCRAVIDPQPHSDITARAGEAGLAGHVRPEAGRGVGI